MVLNGSAAARQGASIYVYAANASMDECFFQSADGEWLIIPQEGGLVVMTNENVPFQNKEIVAA